MQSVTRTLPAQTHTRGRSTIRVVGTLPTDLRRPGQPALHPSTLATSAPRVAGTLPADTQQQGLPTLTLATSAHRVVETLSTEMWLPGQPKLQTRTVATTAPRVAEKHSVDWRVPGQSTSHSTHMTTYWWIARTLLVHMLSPTQQTLSLIAVLYQQFFVWSATQKQVLVCPGSTSAQQANKYIGATSLLCRVD
jgi:hypothetical protein